MLCSYCQNQYIMDVESLCKLTVRSLKSLLAARGLQINGVKSVLVQRLHSSVSVCAKNTSEETILSRKRNHFAGGGCYF